MNIKLVADKLKHCKPCAAKATLSLLSGMLYAAALPPLNLEFAAFVMLVPLLFVISRSKPLQAAMYGWLWGIGWSFFHTVF